MAVRSYSRDERAKGLDELHLSRTSRLSSVSNTEMKALIVCQMEAWFNPCPRPGKAAWAANDLVAAAVGTVGTDAAKQAGLRSTPWQDLHGYELLESSITELGSQTQNHAVLPRIGMLTCYRAV